ncbi:MAG: cyclomaltodextrinase [Candidatus Cloacimonetes bacterium]|nr:cyclomaltodextrinase [Candidatus Cloacimonadota bacterium]
MSLYRFTYSPLTAGEHTVGLAGDFSAWKIIPMQDLGGIFQHVLEIPVGKYHYKLIVDGVWMHDENCAIKAPDPYGGYNSVLIIYPEEQARLQWDKLPELYLHKPVSDFVQFIRSSELGGELRFTWPAGMADKVFLQQQDKRISLRRIGGTAISDVYQLLLDAEMAGLKHFPDFSFFIEINHHHKRLYLDAKGLHTEAGMDTPIIINVSGEEIFEVPQWVGKSIIYQIFPDRFCNGDRHKNPDFSQWYYHDCKTPPPEGEFLPPEKEYYHFVDDWYDVSGLKQSPYLPEAKPDWWSFYGGDIPGVQSKLSYLKDLGINTIYFNPLWQAKSNHKYDSADYHSIDPQFSTTQEMIDFVEIAHQQGIKIILDVAFNHTGETFWAFRDCVEIGEASPYWNWYDWFKWPLPKPLPPDFKPKEYYQCWWGIKDMPDLNYDLARPHPDENAIRDIKDASPNWPLVDYLLGAVKWWLLDIGIDGFRLDVPDEVPFWFWELFRREVKKAKPDAWIVGEIWHHAEDWISARYFDSVMNYACFKNPVIDYFILGQISKREFVKQIETGLALYPWHALQAMMNLLGSHDTLRIFSLAKGNTALIKLAVLFQMCFIGAPHIYYGDEIALPGAKDPDNRRPFNWKYLEDPELCAYRDYYKALILLRKEHPALSEGSFSFLETGSSLLAFEREDRHEKLTIIINADSSPQPCLAKTNQKILFGHLAAGDKQIEGISGIVFIEK